MTDYYVRPVNGDDTANGLTPATAWKTFFAPTDHVNSRGGTYNCATVTDGDTVFLWAEGTTGGEVLTDNFSWFWPLKNGNVCCIGVNESGVEDGTRYNIYLNEGWSSGFGVNANGATNWSAYYPELTSTYEGLANYIWLGKNLRWTESKTIDSSQGSANGSILIGSYMSTSRPILYNCESGPFTTTVGGRGLPTQSRYGGDLAWVKCYFHDIASVGDPPLGDITIVGCLFDNVSNTIDSALYGGGPIIINNVFSNHTGTGVIKLNEGAGNEYAFGLIANNVFYNNDGYCIQSEDDQSLSKLHIHNNIFDSNETVFDLNSISHTYAMVGLSNNIFNNNTNIMLNAGSNTIDDFMSIGFGAGGSGGVGTSAGMDNVLSGAITYVSGVTGPSGDYRLDTTSDNGLTTGALLMGAGIGNKSGSAPFTVTDSGSLSLGTGGVGDTVVVSGRSFQKISDDPIVWRRYSAVVAADSTGSFVPSDISGLAGWWDAKDSDTLTLSSTSVTQWDDKSGNSRHVSQSTSSNKPTYSTSRQINGINVLDFDGSNDLLSLSSAYISNDGISAVAVFIADDVTGGSNIYEGKNVIASWVSGNGQDFSLGVRDSNLNVYAENTGGGREAQGGSVSVSTGIIAFGESNSTHTKSGLNGNTPVSTTASRADLRFTGFGKDTSGGSIYFNGAIAEIIVYDVTSVSTEERQKLEGYLAHKWGLTGNLPSDHPYKVYGP